MIWLQDGGIHKLIINGELKEVIKFAPNHCFTDASGEELSQDLFTAKRIVEHRYDSRYQNR